MVKLKSYCMGLSNIVTSLRSEVKDAHIEFSLVECSLQFTTVADQIYINPNSILTKFHK